jgi:flagellar basal body-associated protein FliL
VKKWQTWLMIILVAVLLATAIGGVYYIYTMNNQEEMIINEEPTVIEGESELNEAGKELENIEELDMTELDEAEKELEETDLSEF